MANTNQFLSFFSIQMFKQCKRKYKYRYVDKLGTEFVPNKHLSFGNSIHKALADYNKLLDPQYRTLEVLIRLFRKGWIREGYESIEEEAQFGKKGLEILTNYFNAPQDPGQLIFAERKIRYPMEDQFVLYGELDKALQRDDGEVEIIDYKTGMSSFNDEFPENDMQLSIYTVLAGKLLGAYPRYISYYYLIPNFKVTKEVDEKNINSILQLLHGIYEEIRAEKEFPKTPNQFCALSCPYYDSCYDQQYETNLVMDKINGNQPIVTVF